MSKESYFLAATGKEIAKITLIIQVTGFACEI